ncbi:MAG TPA: DUF1015 domain-containing protein [Solirubrobacterales bacterium]|jgi:uncharacterized protein (DUF1015 family)|nr:DUF1015 domain-containing protein [Solirubrobacterales bacterium]
MADVQPFQALHYDLGVVGSLDAVAAPPYDVIDAAGRAALLARSPYNAVAIDLPKPFDPADPASDPDGDPYEEAARTIDAWRADGALVTDARPSIWALTQDYTAPDGSGHSRHGILARVRVVDYDEGVRPHERTHPGPLLDRLQLTRATGYNLSPIFSLSTEDAWPLVEPALTAEPWGEATDETGTVNRVWQVTDPAVYTAVSERLADAELLIADGHHRYETARAYRDEIGGEGPHNYTLMALTGLDDPGLTVFPTHRLLSGFAADPERQRRLGAGLRELFEITEVTREQIDPGGEDGVGVFGLYDNFHKQAYRLRLKDTADLDRRLHGKPESYRRLDSAILETLVLKGLAGMSDGDIDERRGLEYAKSVPDALAMVDGGGFDVAFIQCPVPVEQVKAVAETDANMPPKSTYFFPKVMTGFAFNPVR